MPRTPPSKPRRRPGAPDLLDHLLVEGEVAMRPVGGYTPGAPGGILRHAQRGFWGAPTARRAGTAHTSNPPTTSVPTLRRVPHRLSGVAARRKTFSSEHRTEPRQLG